MTVSPFTFWSVMLNTRSPIKGFFGEYRWLSNFAPCSIVYDGIEYPSVEHAYVAAKTVDVNARIELQSCTSGQAKRIGRTLQLRIHWEQLKVPLMRQFLIQKFTQEPYRSLLIETQGRYLEETNTWNDRFWGVCGTGQNMLGSLIMDIRDSLTEENSGV